MFNKTVLNGAWEERGVIGSRIEIDGKEITVLWRNSPVLKTKFKTKKEGDAIKLVLCENGLRYEGSVSDYAEVTEIVYKDEKLYFRENFPITGPSETVMQKTKNSRYGAYEIVDDEVIPRLEGVWKDRDGYFDLRIKGNTVKCREEKTKFHVLSPSSGFRGEYTIVDVDSSRYSLFEFVNVVFDGQIITATIPVCDAPSHTVTFEKRK